MNIGLTFDLKDDYLALGFSEEESAEFDKPDTIEAIEIAINKAGHTTERIGNIWDLTKALSQGKTWDLVFNIAEGLRGIGREAQVPALLDAYNIPYTFSDPLVLSLSLHKGMTKRVLRDLNLATTDFAEIKTIEDIESVNLPFPVFAKPIAEGTSKGVSLTSIVKNEVELKLECERLINIFHQPVLLETFLPGREFTVGIIGTGSSAKAIGCMEVLLSQNAEQGIYSYNNKENYEEFVKYRIVEDEISEVVEKLAIAAYKGLGCRDAGRVDIRLDANGIPNIIELNPLAGLHPVRSDLPMICNFKGISYQTLIEEILNNASERIVKSDLTEIVENK
ncbi:MAG: ATP-grasp domain-containing protein [Bacteroidetes bacterium]|nr:ATP-grasp domain-containing protein [Bacteroidota bacterium]